MSIKVKNNHSKRSTLHIKFFREIKRFLKLNQILNEKKIVALSGGLDSMVLYFVLAEIAKQEKQLYPIPVYIAHGQRSKQDEAFDIKIIKKLLKNYGVPLHVEKIISDQKSMSEDEMRGFRQKFLIRYAKQNQSRCILTGHHQDDQIENFFLRLFSGAHFEGMSGMKNLSGHFFYKPLLGVSKKLLLSIAKDNNIVFSQDVSNESNDFTRNHIRNVLLPMMDAQYGNKYKKNILNYMQDYSDINDYLKSDLKKMLDQSKIKKDSFLRVPLLSYSDLQLRYFLNHIFSERGIQLNQDQLNKIIYILLKGEGSYALNGKVKCKVIKDRAFIEMSPNT